MKFNPIGMGGLSDTVINVQCVCSITGKGCGPISHLGICICEIGGIGNR